MGLYLIEHAHTADTCPTRNPEMVRQLRAHIAPESAQALGVSILGDWVSEPEHRVVFIVESDKQESVEKFASPFQQMGQVEIRLGLTCEETARACLGEA